MYIINTARDLTHFYIPLMPASMQIIRFFSLRAAFSPSDKLGLHLLKKLHYYGSIKITSETISEGNNNKTKKELKSSWAKISC